MASRGDIKDAFYQQLSAVAGTYDVTDEDGTTVGAVTLDEDDITLRHPSDVEDQPQIVYHDDYTPLTYNGVGRAPHDYELNPDGSVAAALYHGFEQAQFIVDIRVGGVNAEMRKEPIYEAAHRAFSKFEHGAWDSTDFHEDAEDVWVESSSTADIGDVEDVIRGDQFEVYVVFKRVYRDEQPNIEDVEHEPPSDGSNDDLTYLDN